MNYFYLDKNGQQQGPIEANELPKHDVTHNTKVWKQGMNDWQEAGTIPELFNLFSSEDLDVIPQSNNRASSNEQSFNRVEKSSNQLVWVLCFFLVVAIIIIIVLSINLSDAKRIERIRNNEIDELSLEISKQKQKNSYLQDKFDDLRETFPLKITKIELANSGDNNNYEQTLYSSTLKYLTPKIHFENYLKESKTFDFEIHYYNAWGEMDYNKISGITPTSEVYISTTDTEAIIDGWGTKSGGSWKAGTWRVEIWYNGVCLGSRYFTIR